jgi:hypothetical protein
MHDAAAKLGPDRLSFMSQLSWYGQRSYDGQVRAQARSRPVSFLHTIGSRSDYAISDESGGPEVARAFRFGLCFYLFTAAAMIVCGGTSYPSSANGIRLTYEFQLHHEVTAK